MRSRRTPRTHWALTAIQGGAVAFAGGLTLLYLNPFWHFDDRGFLDWRVHWWNGAAQLLIAAGLVVESGALLGSVAMLVSRMAGRRSWPYWAVALVLLSAVIWTIPVGFVRELDGRFEWNAADGFSVFRLQSWDEASSSWRPAGGSTLQWFVALQLEPFLRGYFKLNDWQKMNGDVHIKLMRVIPILFPVSIGGGDETLEDPDKTPLMRALSAGNLTTVKQSLAGLSRADVNALDEGGESALILACRNPKPNLEVVKALLAAGADPNLRDRTGYTALTWAQVRKKEEIIRALRRAGARP